MFLLFDDFVMIRSGNAPRWKAQARGRSANGRCYDGPVSVNFERKSLQWAMEEGSNT
jgi:hypothetical protein